MHRLSIDSFIPLSKQPTADVRSVLPSHEHTNRARCFLHTPHTDSSVDSTLLPTAPNISQSLLEFVDIVDLHLIHTLLRDCPNLVSNGNQIRTVAGP